ncbi:MAG: hypothetical protein U0807_09830 [Candidatus Binatia bacterium]
MLEHILRYPLWLQAWIAWLGLVNLAAILFLRQVQARWALAAFGGAAIFMSVLLTLNGFNRLLGLAHVVFWTPLVIYLVRQRPRLEPGSAFSTWVTVLLATNSLSLVIDYVDVIRYVLGGRT